MAALSSTPFFTNPRLEALSETNASNKLLEQPAVVQFEKELLKFREDKAQLENLLYERIKEEAHWVSAIEEKVVKYSSS